MLEALPLDLIRHVTSHLSIVGLLTLSRVSRRLSAHDEAVWRERLEQRHRRVLAVLFGGVAPAPHPPLMWKQHYFDFAARWKERAEQSTGRVLLVIGDRVLGGGGATYGVYDVTEYRFQHPGAEMLLAEAAEERDATELFEITSHSMAARRTLKSLAVAGLEALPYDEELDVLRRKRLRHRWWREQLVAAASWGRTYAAPPLALCACCTCTVGHGATANALVNAVRYMQHAPRLLSAFIVVASLRGWSWAFCLLVAIFVLLCALRCGAVLSIAEFFGALIDGPVLPCATAVTALSCGAIAPPLLSGRARITIAPAPREGAVRSADGSG